MDSTLNPTLGTALLASGLKVDLGWRGPVGLRAHGHNCVLGGELALQDAAVLTFDMAVAIPVVNDHTSSTRLGSPSCSPPV